MNDQFLVDGDPRIHEQSFAEFSDADLRIVADGWPIVAEGKAPRLVSAVVEAFEREQELREDCPRLFGPQRVFVLPTLDVSEVELIDFLVLLQSTSTTKGRSEALDRFLHYLTLHTTGVLHFCIHQRAGTESE